MARKLLAGCLFLIIAASLLMSCAAPSPLSAVEAGAERDARIPAGLFPVRMQPAQPQQPGPFAVVQKGGSFLLPAADTAGFDMARSVSFTEADLVKPGAGFDPGLMHNRVDTTFTPYAQFSPQWDPAAGQLSQAAYCIYRFQLKGYAATGRPVTIAYSWEANHAPTDFHNLWIGMSNRWHNHWDWYQGEEDGVISLPSYGRYTAQNGEVLVAVVVLGSDPCSLLSLRVGAQELRALGVVLPGAALTDLCPRPAGASSVPDKYDWRLQCSPIGDQLLFASSTAFAVGCGALDLELKQVYGADGWDLADPFNRTSAKYLYKQTDALGAWGCGRYQGRIVSDVFGFAAGSGVATEQNVPYTNVAEQDWGQDAEDDAALLKLQSYRSINPAGAEGVAKLKYALSGQHKLVVLQTGVDWDFFQLGPDDVWNYHGGTPAGYQALVLVAYEDEVQAFKARNSWGNGWADGGYCWLGYQTFLDQPPILNQWAWTLNVDYDPAAAQRFCSAQQALPPPTRLMASAGEFNDRIELAWVKSAGAVGYNIYRDQSDTMAASLGDVETWADPDCLDGLSHTYWVRATDGVNESGPSAMAVGWAGLAPAVDGVAPTTAETGSWATFIAQAAGTLPLAYSWDFAGGAEPGASDQARPVVHLGAPGSYDMQLTVTNSHGSAVYPFTVLITPPSPRGWPMYGHDRRHSHLSLHSASQTGKLLWSYDTGAALWSGTVVALDGTVYTGNEAGVLSALNPDGSLRWSYDSGAAIRACPATATDGTVYCADSAGRLQALAADGTPGWNYTATAGFASPLTLDDGDAIYAASADGMLHVLSPAGTLNWQYALPAGTTSTPVINDWGATYIGCADYCLYALDSSGTLQWYYSTWDTLSTSPAIGLNGWIYFGSDELRLYGIKPDGTFQFSFELADTPAAGIAIGNGGEVYFAAQSWPGKLTAATSEGVKLAEYETAAPIYCAPVIGADGTLYLGTLDGGVYALFADGELKWQVQLGTPLHSPPAIGVNGEVFFGADDGKLYAFGD